MYKNCIILLNDGTTYQPNGGGGCGGNKKIIKKPEYKLCTEIDKKKITENSNIAKPYEIKYRDILINKLKTHGVIASRHPRETDPFDMFFNINGENKFIELECATNQDNWQNSVFDIKHNLGVWARKMVPKNYNGNKNFHWHVFIKYNKQCSSFFAFTFEFVQQFGKYTIVQPAPYATSNAIYEIPWETVKQFNGTKYCCIDDFDGLIQLLLNI